MQSFGGLNTSKGCPGAGRTLQTVLPILMLLSLPLPLGGVALGESARSAELPKELN